MRMEAAQSMVRQAPAGGEGQFEATLQACVLGESLPGTVLLAPWGQVASANGDFVIDEQAVEAVLQAHAAHGTDLPIDYEHQSLGGSYAAPDGLAPAAGWIRALRAVRPGEVSPGAGGPGLWADVEWTESGRQRIAAREYRYLSPVVLVRKSDRRVVALHSAALTNKPAIVGMRPIVNREQAVPAPPPAADRVPREHSSGQPTEVATAVIEPSAAVEAAGDAPCHEALLAHLRADLGLEPQADVHAVLIAASERLAGLTRERAEQAAEQRVAAAARAGKVTPGLRPWAMELAMSDPACFDAWVAAAPVIVTTGRTTAPLERGGRSREAVVASARASYRSEPALASLTSEDAWVAQALREAGIASQS